MPSRSPPADRHQPCHLYRTNAIPICYFFTTNCATKDESCEIGMQETSFRYLLVLYWPLIGPHNKTGVRSLYEHLTIDLDRYGGCVRLVSPIRSGSDGHRSSSQLSCC